MVSGDIEPGIASYLSSVLQRVVFGAGDYILHQGEFSHGMVFLSSGEVEVLSVNTSKGADGNPVHTESLVTTLAEHSFFGEMSLLDDAHKSTASVRVRDQCEGWLLAVEAYHQVVSKYPSFREYLKSVAMLRLNHHSETQSEEFEARQKEARARISHSGSGRSVSLDLYQEELLKGLVADESLPQAEVLRAPVNAERIASNDGIQRDGDGAIGSLTV